jgi:two-component system, NarL family, sensor kinase
MTKIFLRLFFCFLLFGVINYSFADKSPETSSKSEEQNLSPEEQYRSLTKLSIENRKIAPASSLIYATEALVIAEQLDNRRYQIEAHNNIGVAQSYSSEYGIALEQFFKALVLLEQENDSNLIAITLNNIGNIYFQSGDKDQAIQYYLRSLEIKEKAGNFKNLSSTLINLGSLYNSKGSYERAVPYISRAIEMIEKESDSSAMSAAWNNLGNTYKQMGDLSKALEVNLKALDISKMRNNEWDIAYISNSIGDILLELKDHKQALAYIQDGLKTAKKINSRDLELYSLRLMTIYYSLISNYEMFLISFRHYESLSDSIFSEENNRAVAEMQVIYRTGQKEKENAIQKLRIAKEVNLRNSFIFISIIVLVMIAIVYRRYHIKNRINEELERLVRLRTSDLIKSHEHIIRLNETLLTNTIETEERERRRFSEDLHDGLGPLLSTVKIHMELISAKQGQPDEQKKLLQMTSDLIDDAIHSARDIANNLMPNILSDFGLAEAMQVYIEKINAVGALHIKYVNQLRSNRYPKKIELALYRICLELINNTMKHSGAKSIALLLSESTEKIMLHYSDNGTGFDMEDSENSKNGGLGMSNIISRIKSINGKYTINTSKGKAFEMFVEIEIV